VHDLVLPMTDDVGHWMSFGFERSVVHAEAGA
jgi:hypothetical protein